MTSPPLATPPPAEELIAKLEAATEGSHELDIAIYEWDRDAHKRTNAEWLELCRQRSGTIPPWTTSLDAALTLVPDDDWWSINWVPTKSEPPPFARASVTNIGRHSYAVGATPALALCIAALKARSAS